LNEQNQKYLCDAVAREWASESNTYRRDIAELEDARRYVCAALGGLIDDAEDILVSTAVLALNAEEAFRGQHRETRPRPSVPHIVFPCAHGMDVPTAVLERRRPVHLRDENSLRKAARFGGLGLSGLECIQSGNVPVSAKLNGASR